MNTLSERLLLRIRLLLLSLMVGVCSSALAIVIVGLWTLVAPALAITALLAWAIATLPWMILSAGIAADLIFLMVARGAVVVPTLSRVAKSVEKERQITKRPDRPLGFVSKFAFYTNPLMPLTMATATFLEGRPALEPAVTSLHDAIMRGPRRKPVSRLSSDWNDHRLRGKAVA